MRSYNNQLQTLTESFRCPTRRNCALFSCSRAVPKTKMLGLYGLFVRLPKWTTPSRQSPCAASIPFSLKALSSPVSLWASAWDQVQSQHEYMRQELIYIDIGCLTVSDNVPFRGLSSCVDRVLERRAPFSCPIHGGSGRSTGSSSRSTCRCCWSALCDWRL